MQKRIKADVEYVVQREQLGTGHAVMQAAGRLSKHEGAVLVTYGDTPLYRAETFRNLIDEHMRAERRRRSFRPLSTIRRDTGEWYATAMESFAAVVEERDIDDDRRSRAIKEINTGSYCFNSPVLFELLSMVRNDNQQGEYYLPDVLGLLLERGMRVGISVLADASEALGINDRRQLAVAEEVIRRRVDDRLMESGVTIVDPAQHVHPS